MSKTNYNKDFLIWKANVTSYLFKIIKKLPDEIAGIDLKGLYRENYHPYVGAVMIILKSTEYQNEIFYHDFVIPYRDKVVIVQKTKDL